MKLSRRIAETSTHLQEVVAVHYPATFASSFGAEDMVILDLLSKLQLDVEVFTLDTGRLHEETHQLIKLARQKYARPIRIMHPDAAEFEAYALEHGDNAFYESIELRKRCCAIRKLGPLRRALRGKRLWITGLRRQQSVTRADLELLSYDKEQGLFKLNPLLNWSSQDVSDYVQHNDVPVNELHVKGYPSIGCAPCTRAIEAGEDERAGRWWWEQAESRECGLHRDPAGRLVRSGVRPSEEASIRSGSETNEHAD